VVRLAGHHLVVRNRIYERVFDREWVATHMPDADVRRQRAAYRKGLLRTAAVASVVISAIGALALSAVHSEGTAKQLAAEMQAERDKVTRLLYVADMNVVQQAWDMLTSPAARRAFDLTQEDARVREALALAFPSKQGPGTLERGINPRCRRTGGARRRRFGDVPEANLFPERSRHQTFPISRERNGKSPPIPGVPTVQQLWGAVRQTPQTDLAFNANSRKHPSVGRKGHGEYDADVRRDCCDFNAC
jgi:hypothetical protein